MQEKITAATPKTLFFLLPFVSYSFGTLRERVLRGSFISRLELKQKINLHIWDAPIYPGIKRTLFVNIKNLIILVKLNYDLDFDFKSSSQPNMSAKKKT